MTAQTPDEAAARCTCDYWGIPGENHKPHCEIEGGPHAECALRIHELEAERDSLRARLAAQQPVIDAAIAWEREPDALDHEANNALMEAAYTYRAALSGSVEAADTPPSGTSGHEADTPAEPEQHRLDVWERDDNDWTWRCTCQVHGASWPSERAAQEAADEHAREVAGTPAAEPAPDDEGWMVCIKATGWPVSGRYSERGDAGVHADALNAQSPSAWYEVRAAWDVAAAPAGAPTEPADAPDWPAVFAEHVHDDAFREAFHHAAREYDDAHCSCGGDRWTDDENWSPEYHEIGRRPERIPGSGRIPCGSCNFGGWDVDDGAEVRARAALTEPADDTQETTS